MKTRKAPLQRGFTLVELMIVVCIIGILSTLAIPYYQKMSARAYRAEEQVILTKLRSHFISQYENSGTFATTAVPDGASTMNPPSGGAPIGQASSWSTTDATWKDIPFSAEGSIRMRYQYEVASSGQRLFLKACGMFPGLGSPVINCFDGADGNYKYVETIDGLSTTGILEMPPGF